MKNDNWLEKKTHFTSAMKGTGKMEIHQEGGDKAWITGELAAHVEIDEYS